MYGDDCPRSRDIDSLERQVSDLDYDIRNVRDEVDSEAHDRRDAIRNLNEELMNEICQLRQDIENLSNRIYRLEKNESDTESKPD